ncbi:MAG: citryl-CoA lyase [Patescibacteria group bacterium]|jgi:citrate synthase
MNATSIGAMQNGEYELRGKRLSDLMATSDVVSVAWLAWTGREPSQAEHEVLRAMFVACVDHGTEPPSASVTRTVASCGKPLADSVAAGLLTLGPRHGNACGLASLWMREAVEGKQAAESVVDAALAEKRRLPGLGHPEYDVDPRTMALKEIAKKQLPATPHLDFAFEVARIFSDKKGKPLPLNIDGALGALIADMNAPAEVADAIFLVARSIGLSAHALEEAEQSSSYRRGV